MRNNSAFLSCIIFVTNSIKLFSTFIDGRVRVMNELNNLLLTLGATDELPKEEVNGLIQDYKNGNNKAGDTVIRAYTKFVVRYIKMHYNGLRYDVMDDAIQEGLIALMDAMEHYDPEKGVVFATYAAHWIKKRVSAFIRKNFYQTKRPEGVARDLKLIDETRNRFYLNNKELSLEALAEESGVAERRIQALDLMRNLDYRRSINYESDDIISASPTYDELSVIDNENTKNIFELLELCVDNDMDRNILKMILGEWPSSPGNFQKHREMSLELHVSRQSVSRHIKKMKEEFTENGLYDLIKERIYGDPVEEPEEEWKKGLADYYRNRRKC